MTASMQGKNLWGSGPGWAKQGRDDFLGCGCGEGGSVSLCDRQGGGRGSDRNDEGQGRADAAALFVRAVTFLLVVIAAIATVRLGRRVRSRIRIVRVTIRTLLVAGTGHRLSRLIHGDWIRMNAPGRQPSRHQCDGEHVSEQRSGGPVHVGNVAVLSFEIKANEWYSSCSGDW